MPRKSLIDQLGIGGKVAAYSIGGMTAPQIIAQIAQERNGVAITETQICRHIQGRQALVSEKKAVAQGDAIQFTLESIANELRKIYQEIVGYQQDREDIPATCALLDLRLKALDRSKVSVARSAPPVSEAKPPPEVHIVWNRPKEDGK